MAQINSKLQHQYAENKGKTIWQCQDRFHPPYFAISRIVTLNAAIISMVTTCLDGTILSIPYVFYKTGLLLAPICVIVVWLVYSWTLFSLSICVRKMQSVSFSEILYRLFGQRIQIIFTSLLFLLLFSVILGYFILMKNILLNLIQQFFDSNDHNNYNNNTTTLQYLLHQPIVILLLLLIPILPLLLIENLEKLKLIHFLGFISIFFLIIVMIFMIFHDIISYPSHIYPFRNNSFLPPESLSERLLMILSHLKFYPNHPWDVIEGISILLILYLNHFNFFHLISQLKDPNSPRLIALTICPGAILTIVFCLIGFLGNMIFLLYSNNDLIEDNILLALHSNGDKSLLCVARLMTLLSLMCTIPNMVTPVRLLIYEVERYLFHRYYYPTLLLHQQQHQRSSSLSRHIGKESEEEVVACLSAVEEEMEAEESNEFPTMIIEDWVRKAELEQQGSEKISAEDRVGPQKREDDLIDLESRGRAGSTGSVFKMSRRSSYISDSDECEEEDEGETISYESPRISIDGLLRSPYTHQQYASYGSFQPFREERTPLLGGRIEKSQSINGERTAVYLTSPCREKVEKPKLRQVPLPQSTIAAANQELSDERQVMYVAPEQIRPPKIIQDLAHFGFGGIEASWRQYNLLPIEILSTISEPIKEALEEKCRFEKQQQRNNDHTYPRGIETKDFYYDREDCQSSSPFKQLIIDEEEVKAIEKEEISKAFNEEERKREIEEEHEVLKSFDQHHHQELHQTMKEKFNFYNKLTITCAIVSVVIALAAVLPSQVSIVWELIGSLITPWIAVILPSLCYTKLPHFLRCRDDISVYCAWFLAIIGILCFFVCSYRVIAFQLL